MTTELDGVIAIRNWSVGYVKRHPVASLTTVGEQFVLGVRTAQSLFLDLVTGRFQWQEFVRQGAFMAGTAVLPTILVSLPISVTLSIQFALLAGQVGATSLAGAASGLAFTFDMASGRRVQLADLTTSNPLTAIPPLAQPFIETALNQAPPPHDPGTYPFTVDRWTPDKVYSGAYKAWALTPDELILYMPDYPVGHDEPLNFTPGAMQWFMDGGTVQAHIPLSALAPVLRV